MFKAIIFDFDGTLSDSREVMLLALKRLAGKYNCPEPTEGELAALNRLPIKERFKRIGVPLNKIPEIIQEMQSTFMEYQAHLQPFPGVRECVLVLAEKGFDLYILSTNTRDLMANFLKTNNMAVFKEIISSPDLFGKHDAILKLLQKQGLSREEVLYVGDELRDIEACKSAGIKVLAVSWGHDPLTLLESGSPDFIAHTPEGIWEFAGMMS